MSSIPRVPSKESQSLSMSERWDRYYLLPIYVSRFLKKANEALPEGFELRPWTVNRAVSLFYLDDHVNTFTYSSVEDDPDGTLKTMMKYQRADSDESDIPANLGNRLEDEPQDFTQYENEAHTTFLQKIMKHKEKNGNRELPPRKIPKAPEMAVGVKKQAGPGKKSADSGCLSNERPLGKGELDAYADRRRDPVAASQIDQIRETVKDRVDSVKRKYGKKNAELNARLSEQIKINRHQEKLLRGYRRYFEGHGIINPVEPPIDDPAEDC